MVAIAVPAYQRRTATFSRSETWTPQSSAIPGLDGSGLADRFCAWQGRSGRHYIFTVYSPWALKAELEPGFMFADSVVILTARATSGQRRLASIGMSGGLPDLFFKGLLAETESSAEFHIHLLGRTRETREAIVKDLRPD